MSRTKSVLLLGGDYPERLDALYEEARKAEREESRTEPTLDEVSRYGELREQFEALKVEAEQAGTRVVLRSLNRREWRDLKAKYPPRVEGDEDLVKADRAAGINTDDAVDDMLYAAITSPEFSTRAAFDEWVDDLTPAEFEVLSAEAWKLANVARLDPKSLPELPTRSSDET